MRACARVGAMFVCPRWLRAQVTSAITSQKACPPAVIGAIGVLMPFQPPSSSAGPCSARGPKTYDLDAQTPCTVWEHLLFGIFGAIRPSILCVRRGKREESGPLVAGQDVVLQLGLFDHEHQRGAGDTDAKADAKEEGRDVVSHGQHCPASGETNPRLPAVVLRCLLERRCEDTWAWGAGLDSAALLPCASPLSVYVLGCAGKR